MIRATRDGRALNEMKIELRSHDQAFPSTGQQTTKKYSPAQLAEWFIADLRKQDRDGLQIIDVSDGEQLAGRPSACTSVSGTPRSWAGRCPATGCYCWAWA